MNTGSKALYNLRIRGIRLLYNYHLTGELHLGKYESRETPQVPAVYAETMRRFTESLTQGETTRVRVSGILRNFMVFLENRGICNVHGINPEDARMFIDEASAHNQGSMDSVIYAMRLFFRYLETQGMDVKRIQMLLSFPMRVKKVKLTFTENELSAILSSIDRSAAPGKRDFALLSLAVGTGIRACDLIRLQLPDIKWADGEIRLSQQKTGTPLSLPVSKPILDSIADYILNERPKSHLNYVFLTCRAPYRTFNGSPDLDGVLKKHMRIAGVNHEKGDGKTFHGLRRFMGTGIVSHGGTVAIAAEVLGHQGISATRQYISMDMDGLRRCVLSRSSIGGVP